MTFDGEQHGLDQVLGGRLLAGLGEVRAELRAGFAVVALGAGEERLEEQHRPAAGVAAFAGGLRQLGNRFARQLFLKRGRSGLETG